MHAAAPSRSAQSTPEGVPSWYNREDVDHLRRIMQRLQALVCAPTQAQSFVARAVRLALLCAAPAVVEVSEVTVCSDCSRARPTDGLLVSTTLIVRVTYDDDALPRCVAEILELVGDEFDDALLRFAAPRPTIICLPRYPRCRNTGAPTAADATRFVVQRFNTSRCGASLTCDEAADSELSSAEDECRAEEARRLEDFLRTTTTITNTSSSSSSSGSGCGGGLSEARAPSPGGTAQERPEFDIVERVGQHHSDAGGDACPPLGFVDIVSLSMSSSFGNSTVPHRVWLPHTCLAPAAGDAPTLRTPRPCNAAGGALWVPRRIGAADDVST